MQSAGTMTDYMMIRWICKKRFRKCWYNLFRHKGVVCYSSPQYCYTIAYRFALACFHGKCRKKVILDFFYESRMQKAMVYVVIVVISVIVIWLMAKKT